MRLLHSALRIPHSAFPTRLLLSAFFILHSTLAACALSAQAAPAPIRVLTYNIRYSLGDLGGDGKNSWQNRRDALADVITRHPDGNGPYDFVGNQEVMFHSSPELNQRDFLASKLTGYGVIGRTSDQPNRTSGVTIFWKKDRWHLDPNHHGTFWLSDSPTTPGSKARGANHARGTVHGLFHEIDARGTPTGRRIYVYNTHLDNQVAGARELGAKLILAHMAARADKTAPVVLMGDMNCDDKSNTIRYLLGETVHIDGFRAKPPLALIDTFARANPDEKQIATMNDYETPGKTRIDYILATPDLRIHSSKIIRTRRPDGPYPSDHFPVETVFTPAP